MIINLKVSQHRSNINKIILANGCFWCTEAIFQQLNGVLSVMPGYSGGHRENPSYEQVSVGVSGHAEAIQIEYESKIISLETLLDVFWHTHNPTTLNKQGNDEGEQYRSAIFYANENEKIIAKKSKIKFEAEGLYSDPIVTEITKFKNFYPAESYHKNYYKIHSEEPYCQFVIKPKLEKFWSKYSKLTKKSATS
ncbi:peptide-methionine (S)-S-oxide reductase MsrA [Candidatus Woesebacteria bacterium]|nr:peptide-methionine (S)-S-oxide reductase MsrA [Candidatus Woesebacteria bacterium]